MADAHAGAREGLSTVTRGTLILLIGTLGFVIENFLSRVILARAMSPHQWGEFSLGLVLAGLLATAGALGLPQALARNLPLATNDAERRGMVRTAFVIITPAAAVVTGLMFATAWPLTTYFHSPVLAQTVTFFALAVAFSIFSSLIAAVFQGYEDVRPNAFFNQILGPTMFIVFLAIGEGIIPTALPYAYALGSYVVSTGVTLAVLGVFAARRLPRLLPRGPRDPTVGARLFRFAIPLFVVGVGTFLSTSGDTLVLGLASTSTVVGLYTPPLSLARLLLVGIGALAYIFLPVTSRFVRRGDLDAVRITYATATKWVLVTSLPLFLLFFFLPNLSLGFVYGAQYLTSPLPLQVLVLGAFGSTLVGPSVMAQVGFGQTRLLVYNTLVMAAADLVLSVALIPPYGALGAAIAWAVASLLGPLLSAVELAVFNDVHTFHLHYLVPLGVTAVPLALFFTFVPLTIHLWELPVILVLIIGLYIAVVLLTRSVDDGDRLLLEAVEGLLGRRIPLVRRIGRRLMRAPR